MSHSVAIPVFAIPIVIAIVVGSHLLRRALRLPQRIPEETALAFAWVFAVGSLVWLYAYVTDTLLLGFGPPWTWLAASHFAAAGFGALTVTALSCRVVTNAHSLRVLRALLLAHPVAYLVIAGGISGFDYCDELGSAGYEIMFVLQWLAVVFGKPNRMAAGPRRLLIVALTVPVVTLVFAIAWAWGRPVFDLMEMVHYHGLVNAVGHVGLALVAFAWGRPSRHGAMRPNWR